MKIGCVVVIYNPDIQVMNNIKKYPKLDEVILVDNSLKNNEALFKDILNDNIKYIPLMSNTGIAHALNIGIKKLSPNVNYVITMDQDSVLNNGIIEAYRKYENVHKEISALTPQYNTDRNPVVAKKGYKSVELSMQSGTLFNREIFNEIGYFDENLFMDVVDWEFFLRMKKNGYKLIQCDEAVLNHNPAKTRVKNLLLYKLKYGVASPTRYYYQARNLLWVAKKYNSKSLYKNLIVKWLKILLLFDDKKEYFNKFSKGIKDANDGKLGKYEG